MFAVSLVIMCMCVMWIGRVRFISHSCVVGSSLLVATETKRHIHCVDDNKIIYRYFIVEFLWMELHVKAKFVKEEIVDSSLEYSVYSNYDILIVFMVNPTHLYILFSISIPRCEYIYKSNELMP